MFVRVILKLRSSWCIRSALEWITYSTWMKHVYTIHENSLFIAILSCTILRHWWQEKANHIVDGHPTIHISSWGGQVKIIVHVLFINFTNKLVMFNLPLYYTQSLLVLVINDSYKLSRMDVMMPLSLIASTSGYGDTLYCSAVITW